MPAMPSNAERISRRSFLELAWKSLLALSGLVGLGGLLRFLGYQTRMEERTEFDLGDAGDYPPGSRTIVADGQAILLHTPEGFTALSLRCPHLGCRVEPILDGFACPCHGSRFDPTGALLRGPATHPLEGLRLEETGGELVLYLQE